MTLITLLDRCSAFEPEYLPSRNSDHLPMALSAMHGLGAPDEALLSFFDQYSEKLTPVDDSGEFFKTQKALLEQIQQNGMATVVSEHLPSLLPGLATRAFHPLIRLGFGIRNEHPQEVAAALSYWQLARFEPGLAGIEPGNLRSSFMRDVDLGLKPGPFSVKLHRLVSSNQYPAPLHDSLDGCAAASLDVYLGTRNFFALHLVTATEAAVACSPYVDEALLIESLTAGLRAAYQIVAAPDFSEPLPIPQQVDPEHAIKYCHACLTENQRTGDQRYLTEIQSFKSAGLVPEWVSV